MSSASSGFLRGAAATALGIAGGQLLFQGIESMFGHHAICVTPRQRSSRGWSTACSRSLRTSPDDAHA